MWSHHSMIICDFKSSPYYYVSVLNKSGSKWMLHTGGGWGETPHMIVKRFGCMAIHNKALYKCLIHSFIHSKGFEIWLLSIGELMDNLFSCAQVRWSRKGAVCFVRAPPISAVVHCSSGSFWWPSSTTPAMRTSSHGPAVAWSSNSSSQRR